MKQVKFLALLSSMLLICSMAPLFFDIDGNDVKNVGSNKDQNFAKLDTANLTAGIYQTSVKSEKNTPTKDLIIG